MQEPAITSLAGRPLYDWGPADGSADAPAVLVVHGLGDHGRALPYRRLAAGLRDEVFAALAAAIGR